MTMKKYPRDLVFFVVLIVLALAALEIFVLATDANKYRPQLTEMLGEEVGRRVEIGGPIAFFLGTGGVRISMRDVSILNPEGARAPHLANLGKLELNLGLLSILTGNFFDDVSIEGADVFLDLGPSGDKADAPMNEASAIVPRRAFLRFRDLKIAEGKITFLGADGKSVVASLASAFLKKGLTGSGLVVNGTLDGAPVTVDIKTNLTDFAGMTPFSIDVIATYDNTRMAVLGSVDRTERSAKLSLVEITAGNTKMTGALNVAWDAGKPVVRGTLGSDRVDWADFKPVAPKTVGEDQARLFGATPLPVGALKVVDADVAIAVGEFPVGQGAIKRIKARLSLADGKLTLSPLQAHIGASPVDAMLVLDTSRSPARMNLGMVAKDIDLGDLQKLAGMQPFVTGKAEADIRLAGDGDSARDIASSLGGAVMVTAETGEIVLPDVAARLSSWLSEAFASQAPTSALKCLAARFLVKNGIAADNGILLDSAASTIAGKGKIDFGLETMALSLRARTKFTGSIPLVRIEGDLRNLHYSVGAANIVKRVVGSLIGPVDAEDVNVPEIQAAPAGQNVCVYALDHAGQTSGINSPNTIGGAGEKIEGLGNALINGFLLDGGGDE